MQIEKLGDEDEKSEEIDPKDFSGDGSDQNMKIKLENFDENEEMHSEAQFGLVKFGIPPLLTSCHFQTDADIRFYNDKVWFFKTYDLSEMLNHN